MEGRKTTKYYTQAVCAVCNSTPKNNKHYTYDIYSKFSPTDKFFK